MEINNLVKVSVSQDKATEWEKKSLLIKGMEIPS